MDRLKNCFILLLFVAGLSSQVSGQSYQIPEGLHTSDVQQILLDEYSHFFIGSESMSIEEVAKQPKNAFQPFQDPLPVGTSWLRLDLTGNSSMHQTYYLTVNYYLHRVESYVINTSDTVKLVGGLLASPSEKKEDLGYQNKVPLFLDSAETKTIYLKLLKIDPAARPLIKLSSRSVVDSIIGQRKFHALSYASVFLTIALFNLMLFGFTRERLYLYNCLMIAFIALHVSMFLLTPYLSFEQIATFGIIFTAGIIFSGAHFGNTLLNLKKFAPRWDQAVWLLIYGCLAAIIIAVINAVFFDTYYLTEKYVSLFLASCAVINQIIWIGGSLNVWKAGDSRGKIFLLSVSPLIIGSLFYVFFWFTSLYEIIDYAMNMTLVSINVFYGSLTIQILLFSSFVGYRIKKLQDEKLKIHQEYAGRLENDVKKRTKKLKKANKEIKSQKEELEHLNEVKINLFSIISHDLRNPLYSLKGILDLLNQSVISEKELKDMTPKLQQSLDSTVNLMDNLLYWAKSQMEGIEPQPSLFNLTDFVTRNVQLVKHMAASKSIEVETDLEKAITFGDPDMIDLVIRNLMTNAVKFTNQGGHIKVSLENNHKDVVMSVADNGIGINESQLDKIFNRNNLINSRGTMNEKGHGLGLVLCHEFVRINEGQLTVKSTTDKGSTFILHLPKNNGKAN